MQVEISIKNYGKETAAIGAVVSPRAKKIFDGGIHSLRVVNGESFYASGCFNESGQVDNYEFSANKGDALTLNGDVYELVDVSHPRLYLKSGDSVEPMNIVTVISTLLYLED